MVEGNHVVYRISAPSPEEKEEWMKSIRCAQPRLRAPRAPGPFCARGAVGERVRARVSVYACTWGMGARAPHLPERVRRTCLSACTLVLPPPLPPAPSRHAQALTSPLGGAAGCPPTSGFSFLPRASISRDPFYDMLATRKRRIANKK